MSSQHKQDPKAVVAALNRVPKAPVTWHCGKESMPSAIYFTNHHSEFKDIKAYKDALEAVGAKIDSYPIDKGCEQWMNTLKSYDPARLHKWIEISRLGSAEKLQEFLQHYPDAPMPQVVRPSPESLPGPNELAHHLTRATEWSWSVDTRYSKGKVLICKSAQKLDDFFQEFATATTTMLDIYEDRSRSGKFRYYIRLDDAPELLDYCKNRAAATGPSEAGSVVGGKKQSQGAPLEVTPKKDETISKQI